MKKLHIHDTIELTISDLSSEGAGVGHLEGFCFFVEGALPQELVEAKVSLLKTSYGKADLTKVITPSPLREKPPCPYFGTCGGCQIQHLTYVGQLQQKRKRVIDAFMRIGQFAEPKVNEIIACQSPFHYRNKIQLPVVEKEDKLLIGLYRKNSHDIVSIDHCLIQTETGEEMLHLLKKILKKYAPLKQLRHLLIRTTKNQKALLVLVLTEKPSLKILELAKELQSSQSSIIGVVANINTSKNNVILGKEFQTLSGSDYLIEEIFGLQFKISAGSFFQVNQFQIENLYSLAIDYAQLNAEDHLLDAYCGVGTLSLIASKKCRLVTGIEYSRESILNATYNAKLNNCTNVQFIEGDVADKAIHCKNVSVALLNPPRKGADERVLQTMRKLQIKKIVYISCDPATLARDAKLLHAMGYQFIQATPVDLFPQTMHVETVAQFSSASFLA